MVNIILNQMSGQCAVHPPLIVRRMNFDWRVVGLLAQSETATHIAVASRRLRIMFLSPGGGRPHPEPSFKFHLIPSIEAIYPCTAKSGRERNTSSHGQLGTILSCTRRNRKLPKDKGCTSSGLSGNRPFTETGQLQLVSEYNITFRMSRMRSVKSVPLGACYGGLHFVALPLGGAQQGLFTRRVPKPRTLDAPWPTLTFRPGSLSKWSPAEAARRLVYVAIGSPRAVPCFLLHEARRI